MHVPLAQHLVRFPRVLPAGIACAPDDAEVAGDLSETSVTMTIAALEARLEAACDVLRSSLEAQHAAEREHAEAAHNEALATALAEAAARRDAEEGAALAAQIASSIQAIHDVVVEQLAKTLRPLLAEAVAARAAATLVDIVERVLADPDHPALTIRGPAPLLAGIEAALRTESVTFVVVDGDEVSVVANGILIETRLAATLAAFSITELA